MKDYTMSPLPEHLLLQVVSVITDPVTTTDELIPSGETSSLRSNPLKLAEYTLSRKDPGYVGRAKAVNAMEAARLANPADAELLAKARGLFAVCGLDVLQGAADLKQVGLGSTIFAVKPGDGSAREQAASCQKVLGGWANMAVEYATKRYRSNLINWGMPISVSTRASRASGNGPPSSCPKKTTAAGRKITCASTRRARPAQPLPSHTACTGAGQSKSPRRELLTSSSA